MIAVGISILIGVALGLRFNALILVPTIVLGAVITAVVGFAHGNPIWSVAFAMVSSTAGLQIGYFVGAVTSAAVAGRVRSTNKDVAQNFGCSTDQRSPSMFKMLDIQEHMEVVGSDGD